MMATKVDCAFEDASFLDYGVGAWCLPIYFMFFFFFQLTFLYSVIMDQPALSEQYIMDWFGFLWLGVPTMWFGSGWVYALNTIQFIALNENDIFIRRYFLRKLIIKYDEIAFIKDFKINRLMSQTRTFPKGGVGVMIHLTNGKKYRISPNMNDFEQLKKLLIEKVSSEHKQEDTASD